MSTLTQLFLQCPYVTTVLNLNIHMWCCFQSLQYSGILLLILLSTDCSKFWFDKVQLYFNCIWSYVPNCYLICSNLIWYLICQQGMDDHACIHVAKFKKNLKTHLCNKTYDCSCWRILIFNITNDLFISATNKLFYMSYIWTDLIFFYVLYMNWF